MAKSVPHWQVIENVVAALEAVANGHLPEFKVTPKAMLRMRSDPAVRREVDVLLTFRAGTRTISIGVDVKNEARPLDLPDVESLHSKANELSIDRYVVVSTSGYTAAAKSVYSRKGMELITLEEVGDLGWAGLVSVHVHLRQVEFHAITLQYTDGRSPRLEGSGSTNGVKVVDLKKRTKDKPLADYLANHIGKAIPRGPDEPDSGVSPPFVIRLLFTREHLDELRLRRGRKLYVLPSAVEALGRFVSRVELHSFARYRTDGGIEAISCLVPLPGLSEELYQFTLAPTGDEGGGQGLAMLLTPAVPKRVDVD